MLRSEHLKLKISFGTSYGSNILLTKLQVIDGSENMKTELPYDIWCTGCTIRPSLKIHQLTKATESQDDTKTVKFGNTHWARRPSSEDEALTAAALSSQQRLSLNASISIGLDDQLIPRVTQRVHFYRAWGLPPNHLWKHVPVREQGPAEINRETADTASDENIPWQCS